MSRTTLAVIAWMLALVACAGREPIDERTTVTVENRWLIQADPPLCFLVAVDDEIVADEVCPGADANADVEPGHHEIWTLWTMPRADFQPACRVADVDVDRFESVSLCCGVPPWGCIE